MGLLDDAASAISGHSSRSKKSRSHKSHRSHKDRSRSRSRSPSHSIGGGGGGISGIAASIFGANDDDDDRHHHHHQKKHHSSSRSFFGGDDYKKHSKSQSSFFGFPVGGSSGHRSPSYYKRSPRPNFVTRALRRLKRLFRDLVYYAKRHPLKVFMLVVMPLITGGFLTALLAKFGLRLPPAITKMMGIAGKAATGDSIGLVGEAVRMASGAGLGSGLGAGLARATTTSVERGRDGSMQWERRHVEKDIWDTGSSSSGGGGWGNVGGGLMGIAKMFS